MSILPLIMSQSRKQKAEFLHVFFELHVLICAWNPLLNICYQTGIPVT